ncbi:YybH family protein [Brevibacterium oceani]|uniref:YybH family protein n=1 Tax=Brevibacterium oceani TaxID=358099 RepID=UPI0015E6F19B|nr:nuclear transport factor 2 family protein [Brevibacterium oceani]
MSEDAPESHAEPRIAEVLAAADAIVAAFASTDTQAYFAGFAPDATFVFHPEAKRFDSRAEYEDTWQGWIAEGWSVVDCRSSERLVQTFPGGAVFSHTVDTTVETPDGRESYRERESIVFRLLGDARLIAVHEHLSTVPATADADSDPEADTDAEAVPQ